jgi:hypothetical protein
MEKKVGDGGRGGVADRAGGAQVRGRAREREG